jgi:hypothetical protein
MDGSVRLCIDYRGLYEARREVTYSLPSADETLDELKDAYFSHISTYRMALASSSS